MRSNIHTPIVRCGIKLIQLLDACKATPPAMPVETTVKFFEAMSFSFN